MPTPPTPSTQPAATVPPATGPRHRTPLARPDDPLADNAAAPGGATDVDATDVDVAYVAFLFARTARLAQRAGRAAVAAGVQVPGWAGSAAWLYDYHAWTLGRAATPDANTAGQARTAARTARMPPGGGR